jgi:hypothetical protein
LKWIKDLNIHSQTINLPGIHLVNDIGSTGDKSKVDRQDYIRPQSFCTTKEVIEQEGQLWMGRKYLLDMHLIYPKYIKNPSNPIPHNSNKITQLKSMGK